MQNIGQTLIGLTIAGIMVIAGYAVYRNIPELGGKGMSRSQIQAMDRQVGEALTTAFKNAKTNVSVNPNTATATVRLSIDNYTTCTSGGQVHVSGGWSGTSTPNIAHFCMNATETIRDWKCIGGWIVNGDPYITFTGTVTGTGASQSVSLRQGLGWKGVKVDDKTNTQSCQTTGDYSYSSNGLGHINFHMSCVPGGKFDYATTL